MANREKIQQLIENLGVTQRQAARLLGCSDSHLRAFIRENSAPAWVELALEALAGRHDRFVARVDMQELYILLVTEPRGMSVRVNADGTLEVVQAKEVVQANSSTGVLISCSGEDDGDWGVVRDEDEDGYPLDTFSVFGDGDDEPVATGFTDGETALIAAIRHFGISGEIAEEMSEAVSAAWFAAQL